MAEFLNYREWVDLHYPGKYGTGTITQQCDRKSEYHAAREASRHSSVVERRVDNAVAPGSNPGAGTKGGFAKKCEASFDVVATTFKQYLESYGLTEPMSEANAQWWWNTYRAHCEAHKIDPAGSIVDAQQGTQSAPNFSVPQTQETTMIYDVIAVTTGTKETDGVRTEVQRVLVDKRGIACGSPNAAAMIASFDVKAEDRELLASAYVNVKAVA